MGEPFIGEIRMFGGNFAPAGWAFCNGAAHAHLAERRAVHADRHDLRRRWAGDLRPPRSAGPDADPRRARARHLARTTSSARKRASEQVTLTTQQIPIHTHAFLASSEFGQNAQPQGGYFAQLNTGSLYIGPADPLVNLNAGAASPVGGSQPHDNMDAVPRHHVHPVAVRRLPDARPRQGDLTCPIPSWPRFACSPGISRRPAGHSAMGSCCPSRRTPRSFRCSGTFYGGDGKSTFALPESAGLDAHRPGARRLASRTTSSGRSRAREIHHAAADRDARAHALPHRVSRRPGGQRRAEPEHRPRTRERAAAIQPDQPTRR